MATGAAEGRNLPPMPGEVRLAKALHPRDRMRIFWVLLGVLLLGVICFSPAWPDAVDSQGTRFPLSTAAKAALGLYAMALVWWVAEVVPIGITAVAIGVLQALLSIRPAAAAFRDFMDPSIWFIFASLAIGMTFTKTGLTKRAAYRMLVLVGERTSMIYLGSFAMIALLALVMAHTAVAASIFPLLMAIHSLYEDSDKPTRFGKGLFIGMAFVAASASVVSLLGSARAPVSVGFFKAMAGREISFFELLYYMLPLGWGMALLLWGYCRILYPPERQSIPGLRQRARALYDRLGPMSRQEKLALATVLGAVVVLGACSLALSSRMPDQTAVVLSTTVLLFLFRILTIQDLEEIPWNIVLLFGGAMSMGTGLWVTGAARWLGVQLLVFLQPVPGSVFVLGLGLFLLVTTNMVMNVAAIALCLPVGLVVAPYLGVAPEVVMFTALAAAGQPFLLLIGAAPNAIAFGSRQFSAGEFFRAGLPASILLMLVLGLFVYWIWPGMGMPVLLP